MDWIVYKEEPSLLERTGPFAIPAKAQDVYWDLQERNGLIKLARIETSHYNPDYAHLENFQKYWVYELSESAFVEQASNDRSVPLAKIFAEASNYANTDWQLLATRIELAPKIARFNMNKKQRTYLGSGKFDEPSFDITIISNQINQTLSLRTIDGRWALAYELENEDINRVLIRLEAELIAGLHFRLQNQGLDYWMYLVEELINEGEPVALDPNDTRWDSNLWLN